jgi:hypothetical protein
VVRGQIFGLIGYDPDLRWAIVFAPWISTGIYDFGDDIPLNDYFGFGAKGRLGIVSCSVVAGFRTISLTYSLTTRKLLFSSGYLVFRQADGVYIGMYDYSDFSNPALSALGAHIPPTTTRFPF